MVGSYVLAKCSKVNCSYFSNILKEEVKYRPELSRPSCQRLRRLALPAYIMTSYQLIYEKLALDELAGSPLGCVSGAARNKVPGVIAS